jgi:hypothetical protein
MAQRVNLDAMIPRADFGTQGGVFTHQQFKDFPLLHLEEASPIRAMLRKPDFQRETNHWTPEQVTTFVASFVDGALIPSLILWRSALHVFVIDGGHRLSALRGWMHDDYGDGHISISFYGVNGISEEQKRAAKRTRSLIEKRVGRYSGLKGLVGTKDMNDIQTRRVGNVLTRALDHQWVEGTPAVAETSFFKINSQGTPLDDVEEMLLRNRTKAIAIAARAILRAGTGNKYWSTFSADQQAKIEEAAAAFHELLFDPEADLEVRTVEWRHGVACQRPFSSDRLPDHRQQHPIGTAQHRKRQTRYRWQRHPQGSQDVPTDRGTPCRQQRRKPWASSCRVFLQ